MEAVLISSQPYDSYDTVAQADAYLAAAIHGAAWSSATGTTKAQALVTATRILDRQRWADDYDTQEKRIAVQQIKDACVEMALALVDGSDFQTEETTSQKLSSIKAGSVALTYFRGAEGRPHRFPTIVNELLRDYLAGATGAVSPVATGTGGSSVIDGDLGFTGGL